MKKGTEGPREGVRIEVRTERKKNKCYIIKLLIQFEQETEHSPAAWPVHGAAAAAGSPGASALPPADAVYTPVNQTQCAQHQNV